jgi:hypothetical protein
MFTLIDFRQRNFSSSFQSNEHSKILSYLYNILWSQNQISPVQTCLHSSFTNFIILTLQTNTPLELIPQQVQLIGNNLQKEDLFIFLRRALFFQYFVLGDTKPLNRNVFDWKEELKFETLCQRYNFNFTGDVFLRKFPFINLPNSFLDFARPTFLFPLHFQNEARFICLIDGGFVKISHFDPINFPIISDYIHSKFSFYTFPIPFLKLSGEKVTEIFFINFVGQTFSHQSVYLDEFGIPDEGFKRNKFLTLSETKIQQLIEDMLALNIEIDV